MSSIVAVTYSIRCYPYLILNNSNLQMAVDSALQKYLTG